MIVVAHNSVADLPACITAVRPTLSAEDELIVYDNASTDGGGEVARHYGARVMRSERNHGFGGANNRAAAAARGRWLVFLNPDAIVEPGWLDPLLEPLAEAPGLATAEILLVDRPETIDAHGNAVHASGITVSRRHGEPARAQRGVERILAVSGAAFAIDRASFERLGGFDERFFMYMEDTDLSLRAALAGIPAWFTPFSRVRHRHGRGFAPWKLYWLERNRWLMLVKVWSARTLLALLPHLALMELMTWTYALAMGGEALRVKARAWRWLLENAWIAVRARRETQRLRRVHDREVLDRCDWRLDLSQLIAAPRLRQFVQLIIAGPAGLAQLWLRAIAR